jgi:hypothetical protein
MQHGRSGWSCHLCGNLPRSSHRECLADRVWNEHPPTGSASDSIGTSLLCSIFMGNRTRTQGASQVSSSMACASSSRNFRGVYVCSKSTVRSMCCRRMCCSGSVDRIEQKVAHALFLRLNDTRTKRRAENNALPSGASLQPSACRSPPASICLFEGRRCALP